MTNPLLDKWDTPYETPPFNLIKTEHFRPAADEALSEASKEIASLAENPDPPTFENTVASLDRSCEKISRISSVLFNLNSAETNSEIQAAAQDISPLLTRFSNDITLNEKLFRRIKTIYDSKELSGLNTEQLMLLDKKYRGFILGGAGLDGDAKARFREISEELSRLNLKFEENVLNATNSFELHINDPDDLKGLPENVIEAASSEAEKKSMGGWIFTLNFPSFAPFMKYAENRDLREKMHRAFSSRCFTDGENDNRSLVTSIVNLRLELARILGFRNYAEMILGDRMAENSAKVDSFLNDIYSFSHKAAIRDFNNLKEFASGKGHGGNIERWDWSFFSEKLRKEKYDIDDEILRPYLRLENVRDAVFDLAGRLFGLKFRINTDIQVYHNEASAWEVYDADGRLRSVLYLDFFPRKGKNGGAWMTSFRDQRKEKGENIIPLISLVTNFSRPTKTKPSLLTFGELTTFLHEFGHALHGMLSECTYESISGTNVARDFVELPSQFMQNWAYEEEWLSSWAVHYKTGEKMPAGIIKKIREASTFNEGYACDRQLGFGFLDMAWHTVTEPVDKNVYDFESKVLAKTDLFPEIRTANISCSFTHLFGGEYAAGYYGYKWAEVLEADAFSHFRETGIFNRETAVSFLKNILSKGGSDKPMNLYIRFRGKEPAIDAFLERSGLK